ncbi:MAG: methyltransferase domain-containing protein [Planctomycetales bacterium]|nr:methyltransferase domain-containing protein [Planctomycetales bacterium]
MNTAATSDDLSQRAQMLQRVSAVLACPECRQVLEQRELDANHWLQCAACGYRTPWSNDQLNLGGFPDDVADGDWLNRAKQAAKKRFGRYYPLAIELLSPICMTSFRREFLRRFDAQTQLVCDLGSGTSSYDDQVLCIDGSAYESVHITANLKQLPLRDESIDGILSIAVLEHVPDPDKHVAEMHRVLRSDGQVCCYVPFMQGYHASPHDYHRFTVSGLRVLFQAFEIELVEVGAGPTSALLWMLQEWLALAFSLGSRRLYQLIMPLTWILSPLKYLDLLLGRHAEASVTAAGIYVIAHKR